MLAIAGLLAWELWRNSAMAWRQFGPGFLVSQQWDPVAGQYFWHRFYSSQPDLNYDNPRVQEEMLNVMRFWLEMGLDGFRADAVPYLFEREGTNCENLPETHDFLKVVRRTMDQNFPGTILLGEANQWPADLRPYFGNGDEFHMAFHFPVMPRIFMGLRQEDVEPIQDIMRRTPPIPESCQWALFLRNHDELTLEMVTDEERDYMYRVYAHDAQARINLGIRRRLAPLMDNDKDRIKLMNSMLLSMPGSPIIYYGDEIGMGDNIYLGDRNGVRTPMQWSPDRNAGFSRADPGRLYTAPISDPVYGYQAVNVEAQRADPSSLLHWVRNLIALRKLFPVFGRGSMEVLPLQNRKVLAFVRKHESERILVTYIFRVRLLCTHLYEAPPHLLHDELIAEGLHGIQFPVMPRTLQELQHQDPHSLPHRPQRSSHGRGRLALAIAGVNLHVAGHAVYC